MGVIDDVLADDAEFGFFDSDLMPMEAITYTKRSGTTRAIKGYIDRLGVETRNNSSYAIARVTVHNDTSTGIASSELLCGADKVTFPYRRGGTDRIWTILELDTPHDGQVCVFLVEGRGD
jgi:hypothetical protein